MKTLRLFIAGTFFAAMLAFSAFGQAAATKIGVIDTRAFDSDKPGTGITKYVNGMNTLESEFKVVQNDIQAMATKYQTLGEEIKKLQAQASDPNNKVPLDPKAAQAKVDEYSRMERDIKFKQEDAKARYQSRYSVVMGPIMQDIGKAMQDFAKQKGFALILDGAKLDESGLVLGIGDDKINATTDFITFYNARPAGSATTVAPK
jgi:Skp family chaperone for outer membrane proteins